MLLILIGKNVYTFPLPGSNMAPGSRTGIVLWIRVGDLADLIKSLKIQTIRTRFCQNILVSLLLGASGKILIALLQRQGPKIIIPFLLSQLDPCSSWNLRLSVESNSGLL